MQLFGSLEKFLIGCLGKSADFYVAGLIAYHVCHINTVKGDIIPGNFEIQQLFFSSAHDNDFHSGPFGSAKHTNNRVRWKFDAGNGSAVYFHNTVAGKNPNNFRRPVCNCVNDCNSVIDHIKLNPNPAEISNQRLVVF